MTLKFSDQAVVDYHYEIQYLNCKNKWSSFPEKYPSKFEVKTAKDSRGGGSKCRTVMICKVIEPVEIVEQEVSIAWK